MGLVVGEGSFTGDKKRPLLQVKLHERDPLPLLALKKVFGGTLHGPYTYHGKDGVTRHSISWYLHGRPLLAALPRISRHLPPSHKRVQFEMWLVKYRLTRVVAGQLEMFHEQQSKPRRLKVVPRQEALL